MDDDFVLALDVVDYLPEAAADAPEDAFDFTPEESEVSDTVEVAEQRTKIGNLAGH